jgi:hypothetical protein
MLSSLMIIAQDATNDVAVQSLVNMGFLVWTSILAFEVRWPYSTVELS